MDQTLNPSDAQLSKFMSLPAETPLAMLNLFEFYNRAEYQPEDPEYGTDAAEISGQQAYRLYGEGAGALIESLGGRVVFSSPAKQVMIDPDNPNWHLAAILFFPSRAAFMQMMSDPDFQKSSRHRKAALKRHHMVHLNGEAFQE